MFRVVKNTRGKAINCSLRIVRTRCEREIKVAYIRLTVNTRNWLSKSAVKYENIAQHQIGERRLPDKSAKCKPPRAGGNTAQVQLSQSIWRYIVIYFRMRGRGVISRATRPTGRIFDGHFASSENRCSPALIIIIARATSQRERGSRTDARYYLTVIVSAISKVFKTARNFNGFLIMARSAPPPAIRFLCEKDRLNLNTLHKLNSRNTAANKRTILYLI